MIQVALAHPCPWNRDKHVGVGIDFGHVRGYPGGFHYGIDFYAPVGEPILAALDGFVIAAEEMGAYGLCIHLYHEPHDLFTVYGHLSEIGVSVGADVAAGQQIGLCGHTGNTTGGNSPHLHFEVREGSDDKESVIDPMEYITPRPDYYSGAMLRWK